MSILSILATMISAQIKRWVFVELVSSVKIYNNVIAANSTGGRKNVAVFQL